MKHTGFITPPVSGGERVETLVLSERVVMDAVRNHSASMFSETGLTADVSCR